MFKFGHKIWAPKPIYRRRKPSGYTTDWNTDLTANCFVNVTDYYFEENIKTNYYV